MTRQGSAYTRLQRALERGNAVEALSAAAELPVVGLADALELTVLLAEESPARYERAAVRWHARFVRECTGVDVRESQAVLALLASLPDNRSALGALALLLAHRRELRPAAKRLASRAGG